MASEPDNHCTKHCGHYGANVARWMYPDLFRDIDTRADQLIAANAVGVRPTFPHRYAIEQTKAYFCKQIGRAHV